MQLKPTKVEGFIVGGKLASAAPKLKHKHIPSVHWLFFKDTSFPTCGCEVGVLDAVFLSHVSINKVCFLVTEKDHCYLGILPFEKADYAMEVFRFLDSLVGKRVATIAATEFPSKT